MRWLTERFEEKNQVSLKGDIFAESRLKTAAEQCKVELSAQESAVVRVPVLAEKDGCPLGLEETVTRELFESLIAGDLTRTRRPVNVALSDSGLHEGDLDMVLLAGGSTRIPAVRRKSAGCWGLSLPLPFTRITALLRERQCRRESSAAQWRRRKAW